ncbi:hypothetical protein WDW86_10390 [Bdellovibrionota bacterium FG-2]
MGKRRKKDEDLTPEEAIAAAKKELTPYWFNSPPLYAAVKTPKGLLVFPLSRNAKDLAIPVLVIALDLMDYAGREAIHYVKEWYSRYASVGLQMTVILRPTYPFVRTPALIQQFIRRETFQVPIVLDHDGFYSEAFGITKYPKIRLMHWGNVILEQDGKDWSSNIETKIHSFLRAQDPGLPLHKVYVPEQPFAQDLGGMEFGKTGGVMFPLPGFQKAQGAFLVGQFKGPRPAWVEKGEVFLSGKWIQDGDRIATSDPTATLGLQGLAPRLSFVAQCLGKPGDTSRVIIELEKAPMVDVFYGSDLTTDDEGRALIKVDTGRLYHALHRLPEENREITLKFPNADKAPVAIYGVRFGS